MSAALEPGAFRLRPLSAVVVAAVLAGAVLAAQPREGVFLSGALGAVFLAAWRPHFLLALLLPLSAADLVLTADAGGFTFRFAQVAAVALLARAVADAGLRPVLRFTWARPGIPAWAALFVAMAVSLAWDAPNPAKGVGYLAWAAFDVAVVAPAVAWHACRWRAHAVVAWGLGAAAVALFGLLQGAMGELGADPPLVAQWVGNRARLNGLSYEPSYFAFQLILPAALLVGVVAAGRWRRGRALVVAALLVQVLALGLSTSRSAWLGTGALLGALLLLGVSRRLGRALRPVQDVQRVLAVALAAAVAAAALLPPATFLPDVVMVLRGVDPADPSSGLPRREGARQAGRLFLRHPALGVGPGQYGGALVRDPSLWVREIPESLRNPDTLVTFNVYLELACETGAVGTLLVLGFVAYTARRLWRLGRAGTRGQWARVVLWPWVLVFLVMYQFNQTLWRTEIWCLVGLAWAWPGRRVEQECRRG